MGIGCQAPPGSCRTDLSRWDGGSGWNFRALAALAIELVQDVEPDGKKGVAPLKRSRCCFFGIAKPGRHRARIAKDG
jgi:hypothetical protein